MIVISLNKAQFSSQSQSSWWLKCHAGESLNGQIRSQFPTKVRATKGLVPTSQNKKWCSIRTIWEQNCLIEGQTLPESFAKQLQKKAWKSLQLNLKDPPHQGFTGRASFSWRIIYLKHSVVCWAIQHSYDNCQSSFI